jgi:hypothetical protein
MAKGWRKRNSYRERCNLAQTKREIERERRDLYRECVKKETWVVKRERRGKRRERVRCT